MASIAVIWILWGYSTAFGDDIGYGLLGNPLQYLGLKGLMGATTEVSFDDQTGIYPVMAFVAFQAVFAIITVALISGAIADRAKFGVWMVFTVIWGTLVYFPVAHWVFDFSSGEHTRWLDRQQLEGNRLRRWHRRPHQRRCRLVLLLRSFWASGSAGSAIRCGHTT